MFHPKRPSCALLAVAGCACIHLTASIANAETWTVLSGTASWNNALNWNPASVPNSVGATAVFNGAATGSNGEQTGNRTANLDAAQTVGSITFNNDLSTFTNTIAAGGGSLTFDEAGAGPAQITTMGFGTGNNTISGPMIFTDSVVANVFNVTASSAAGSLNLTGAISGPGGFTKNGDGTATFGTGAKTYTGETILSGGRMRVSMLARPQNTSSFTINAGAQLTPISAGLYNFGSGTLVVNGSGAFGGPAAGFPGAIRQDTGLEITITNNVVLQSDSVIHVQRNTAGVGSLTLSGNIGGPGRLSFTALPHNDALGTLVLSGSNVATGGTQVNGGNLQLLGASASLGTGDVFVAAASLNFAGASARLTIDSSVINGISDSASLWLSGGGAVSGFADDGYIFLGDGINERVGSLLLGGTPQEPGTYGSSASAADFKSDEFFAGTGVITVIPEPGSTSIFLAGLGALCAWRRRRES